MKRLLATIATGGVLLSSQAPADDGNELYQFCRNGQESAYCMGYIAGVMDTDGYTSIWAERAYARLNAGKRQDSALMQKLQGIACQPNIPAGATLGQMADIVAKYLRDNPESRTARGNNLVKAAVTQAFHCR